MSLSRYIWNPDLGMKGTEKLQIAEQGVNLGFKRIF